MTTLKPAQFAAEGLTDWVWLVRGIEARYETGGFAQGLELVNRIGAAAEQANHHPDLTLTWPTVHVRLFSHDVAAITDRDVAMARTISDLARELGVTATPEKLTRIEYALDTGDKGGASRFWAAVLAYDGDADPDEVVDPDGRQVTLWFQTSESRDAASDEARQRFHVDVHVAPEQAQARIDAALAAGGTLVSDSSAPSFTVIADPEGNKACVCTWQPSPG
jgi:4a-hydroxytetrahydrobiopterin dehydratase